LRDEIEIGAAVLGFEDEFRGAGAAPSALRVEPSDCLRAERFVKRDAGKRL